MRISIHVPRAGDDLVVLDDALILAISIHVPRAGDDDFHPRARQRRRFQSTSPVRGTTPPAGIPASSDIDFNPRPPCGGRPLFLLYEVLRHDFNPRPPCGGRRTHRKSSPLLLLFQSTSPVRGTTRPAVFFHAKQHISIHVPRAGDDVPNGRVLHLHLEFQSTSPVRGTTVAPRRHERTQAISIHVPRAGDDTRRIPGWCSVRQFQSTSPVRGTTAHARPPARPPPPISIHVPRAGDDHVALRNLLGVDISIHVPRAGDDGEYMIWTDGRIKFQSTSPVRGTTAHGGIDGGRAAISIHVPRAGDDKSPASCTILPCISIHVPRAGDDAHILFACRMTSVFQSTSPVRGTTTAR